MSSNPFQPFSCPPLSDRYVLKLSLVFHINRTDSRQKNWQIWMQKLVWSSLILWSFIFRETDWLYSAGIYLFKANNGNPRLICGVSLKLTMKTPNVVIDVALVSLLLTLNRFQHCSGVSIAEFEQINASQVEILEIFLKPVYFCEGRRPGNCLWFTTYFQWLRKLNIWFPAFQVYISEICY